MTRIIEHRQDAAPGSAFDISSHGLHRPGPFRQIGVQRNRGQRVKGAGPTHQPTAVEMQENDTRNQHFVTQGEQRLNALNPQADPRNQRIYSFEVVDRENYKLALESPIGRPIGSNLSLSRRNIGKRRRNTASLWVNPRPPAASPSLQLL